MTGVLWSGGSDRRGFLALAARNASKPRTIGHHRGTGPHRSGLTHFQPAVTTCPPILVASRCSVHSRSAPQLQRMVRVLSESHQPEHGHDPCDVGPETERRCSESFEKTLRDGQDTLNTGQWLAAGWQSREVNQPSAEVRRSGRPCLRLPLARLFRLNYNPATPVRQFLPVGAGDSGADQRAHGDARRVQ